MFAPIARNDRKCVKDWEGEGEFAHIKIPKGTLVRLAYHVIHHDQQYWPEPEQFRPERFLKENAADIVPFSFVAFGSGPRQCIGKYKYRLTSWYFSKCTETNDFLANRREKNLSLNCFIIC